jgi:hypothetical protein
VNRFRLRVGLPEDDALFLRAGFSDAHREGDIAWRNCARVFRLDLPSAARGPTHITFRMRFRDPSTRLTVRAGDRALGTVEAPGTGWHDLAVTAPAAGGEFLSITGELDREPYDPRVPKIDPNRRFADLTRVSVEGDGLVVPADRTRRRIERRPLRLTNLPKPGAEPPGHGDDVRTIFFGDPHVHTNASVCGRPNNGTVKENIAAARERGHDFVAITDHAEHIHLDEWDRHFDTIAACSQRFGLPVLPALEWTSRDHGHRNLYFRRPRPPYVDYFCHESAHPAKLAAFFERHGVDAFAVPHHFPYVEQPGNIGSIAPDAEPLIELYSSWGSSECCGARLQDPDRILPGCTVRDALARGLHLGFVGGGDVHNDLPGDGGMTGVLAEAPTAGGLFDALKARLCYATSGPRIRLDFHVNGFPMGSVVPFNAYSVDKVFPLQITARAVGTAPVDRIELIGNGELLCATEPEDEDAPCEAALQTSIEKLSTPAGRSNRWNQHLVNHSRYYYVRVVQADGAMAWSSPVWLDFACPE